MKAALYLRISTHEQSTASQGLELERFAAARGWTIEEVYEDQISGGKASRPGGEQADHDPGSGGQTRPLPRAVEEFWGKMPQSIRPKNCGI